MGLQKTSLLSERVGPFIALEASVKAKSPKTSGDTTARVISTLDHTLGRSPVFPRFVGTAPLHSLVSCASGTPFLASVGT